MGPIRPHEIHLKTILFPPRLNLIYSNFYMNICFLLSREKKCSGLLLLSSLWPFFQQITVCLRIYIICDGYLFFFCSSWTPQERLYLVSKQIIWHKKRGFGLNGCVVCCNNSSTKLQDKQGWLQDSGVSVVRWRYLRTVKKCFFVSLDSGNL